MWGITVRLGAAGNSICCSKIFRNCWRISQSNVYMFSENNRVLYYQLGIFSKAWIPPLKKYLFCQLDDLFLIFLVRLVAWLRLGGNKSWCWCHWLWIIFSLNLGIWQYNSPGSHFLRFLPSKPSLAAVKKIKIRIMFA